jgi:hypothetical protein
MPDELPATQAQTNPSGVEENLWEVNGVKFWRIDGVLLSVENSTDARVFGGGRTSVNAIYDEPIYGADVDTEFTRYTTFWVQEEGGRECSFRIVNWDVPLRVGQLVSILCAERDGQRSCIAGIINYSSQMKFTNQRALSVLFPRPSALFRAELYEGIHWGISFFWLLGMLGIPTIQGKTIAACSLAIWFVSGRYIFRRRAKRRNAITARIQLLTEKAASR